MLHLIPARITDFSLPMPPQELQQEFSENISPLLNLIDNLQLKNEALVKARDLLLPRLMSGRLKYESEQRRRYNRKNPRWSY